MLRRFASTSSLPPTIRQLLSSSSSVSASATVQVNGWVKSVRRQKKVSFAVISDGSSAQGLQAVFNDLNLAKQLTNGASVSITGRLSKSLGTQQATELHVESMEMLGECDPETYPIQKQALSLEYLRDNLHLRARTDSVSAMLRLRDSMLRTLHKHFEHQGFCYTHTPILTSSDSEGAGESFRIANIVPSNGTTGRPDSDTSEREFFSRPSYLTVSSQLHLEALSSAISRVYTLSPCFRAERSQTNRHLAEFWMLEAEWAFTRTVEDVCAIVESVVKDALIQVMARGEEEGVPRVTDVEILWKDGDDVKKKALEKAAQSAPWPRMSYTDAIKELKDEHAKSRKFQFAPEWGKALQSEHERWLAEALVGGPVFVTDYPAALKPFYMRLNPDGLTVACFDLLVPYVGELAGGSLREERIEVLQGNLRRCGLGEGRDEYGWYADLRKYGGAPHGGFGLGFERLVGWVGGIENVRECIPMPRWAGKMLL